MKKDFELPEEHEKMREYMRENPAHKLVRIEDGMTVLTEEDIPHHSPEDD